MRKTVLLLSLTFLSIWISELAFSQNDEKGTLIGNPTDKEAAANIVADNAGNTYVAGLQNSKALIVKQNAVHTTLWSKAFSFTTNSNHEVVINFFDLVADTVFGCGKIYSFNQYIGTFYFKMDAQNGAMYWSKFEVNSDGYFSCMRYADGKFFLIGGIRGSQTTIPVTGGKVLAVSSQTGNLIWQTPVLYNFLPNTSSPGNWSHFYDATQMINGKLFITGACQANSSALTNGLSLPILIGIDESGSVFLEKYLSVSIPPGAPAYRLLGTKIRYDMDQNLVIGSYWESFGSANSLPGNIFLTKCDSVGNILFSKSYDVDYMSIAYLTAMNETADSYVLYGITYGSFNGSFVLKVDKSGNMDKCIVISKPNVGTELISSVIDPVNGNSSFLNGTHYFVSSESATTVNSLDIHKIILDEELNTVDDCSGVFELTVPVFVINTSIDPLIVSTVPQTMNFQDGATIEDVPAYTYCDNVSLDLVQNSGCSQSTLQANIVGFIDPTFYWSNGNITSGNTLSVNTTDTIFLRVLDTKCCELVDTIVPILVPSSFTMSLPADTSVCLQSGNSLTINPSFSGANAPVQYLWSNNSTGTSLAITSSGTYWVELSDSCLTQRDSIVVIVNSLPVIGDTLDITVCEDDFPAILNPTVSAGTTVLWDDGTPTIQRSVNVPGTYTISAINNCGASNAAITVSQTNLPTVQLIASIDTCIQNGNLILLTPVITGATTNIWSNGSSGNQLAVSNSGNYTIYTSNSCGIDSAACSVTINDFPELDLPATLDTCFDIGVGFSYTAQGSGVSYQWSSGSQTATEWISQEGIYSCTLTNLCGSISDSMQVRRLTAVDLYFPEDSIHDCQHQLSVSLLHIETNYNLEVFSPSGNLIGTHLSESGWYQVHAFNTCSEVWDSIYVNLQNEQFFYLPNSFTPNGDSNNDQFEFKGENIIVRDIRIFNRWGEELFTENGKFTGWDGTYQGAICPVGIYAVHVIYEDCFGIPTEFNGHVNLIR